VAVDLQQNSLAESAGRVIGKMLSTHCKKRDDVVWMYSLRGEEPEEDISHKFVFEVNLANNRLDAKCVQDLCYFLQYDSWTRYINLRHNCVEEQGIAEACRLLDTNDTLISFDLRDNPGFSEHYSQLIYRKLLRNYETLRRKHEILLHH
jgi:centrosomal protein CEP78